MSHSVPLFVGYLVVHLKAPELTFDCTWGMLVETRWSNLTCQNTNIDSISAFETHVLHYMYFYFTNSKAQLLFGSCVIHTFWVAFTLSQLYKHDQSSFEGVVVDLHKHDFYINTIYCLFTSLRRKPVIRKYQIKVYRNCILHNFDYFFHFPSKLLFFIDW